MDTKSPSSVGQPRAEKIFFLIFGLLIIGSVAVTYYKIVVQRDYSIQAQADCDPYTEKCFVHVCDATAGEDCTGDSAQDTSYYKLINRNAKNIPLCDPSADGCDALTCPVGESECTFTLCDETTVPSGEMCNDPVVYSEKNPVSEEGVADGTSADQSGDDTTLDTSSDTGGNNSVQETLNPDVRGTTPQTTPQK